MQLVNRMMEEYGEWFDLQSEYVLVQSHLRKRHTHTFAHSQLLCNHHIFYVIMGWAERPKISIRKRLGADAAVYWDTAKEPSETIIIIHDLGHRITSVSTDDKEAQFLFQRLSIALQRFNVILLHESFESDVDPDL